MLGNAKERQFTSRSIRSGQIIYHEKLKYSGYHEHSSAVFAIKTKLTKFCTILTVMAKCFSKK